MQSLKSLLVIALIFTGCFSFAQSNSCELNRFRIKSAHANYGDGYDVHHVWMDIEMTNQSASVRGSVTTRAVVVAQQLDSVVFELAPTMTIDSVALNGVLTNFRTEGAFRIIPVDPGFNHNDSFVVKVWYHGQVESGGNFIGKGITHLVDDRWNIPVTYTLSEPYFARDWWPVKQSLHDKIDSADIWITVPDGLKAGSNGLLQRVTSLSDGRQRFEWKTTYPTDYYLLSASVAPYMALSQYMKFTGSEDSMLVLDYIYDHPDVLAQYKPSIDSLPHLINFFSDIFGRYPFYKEKYGHCLSPMGGGMEHQTMTTLRSYNFDLVAHELAHQWFGDYVTCKSWRDLWLNEGFATYGEYLAVRHFKGPEAAFEKLKQIQNRVYITPGGSVYVKDTADLNRLFDGRLTYSKAGAVVHMLRYYLGNDSLFFPALRAYLDRHAFGVASTEDFKWVMEQYSNRSLDQFFEQWVYGEGYPHYELRWNQLNGRVILQMQQRSLVPESVPLFSMPVELMLRSQSRDTSWTINLDRPYWSGSFEWEDGIEGVIIDPNSWLLHINEVIYDPNLVDVQSVGAHSPVVYPNPAHNQWRVLFIPKGSEVHLLDISGRLLQRHYVPEEWIELPAAQLSTGIYILEMIFPDGQRHVQKLRKE